jgi:molybdopterin synthase catalytic subunit
MAAGDPTIRSFTALTPDPIDVEMVRHRVADPACGATVLMIGQVRNRHQGRPVDRVTYEAYIPMADHVLAGIAGEAVERWPDLRFALVHRTGELPVGETSVVVAVAASHRAEAFEACRWCIDELKRRLPVWKREEGPGGIRWQEEIPLEPPSGEGEGSGQGEGV